MSMVTHTDACSFFGCLDPGCPYKGYDKELNEMWFGNEDGPRLCPKHQERQTGCELCEATASIQAAMNGAAQQDVPKGES